MASRYNSGLSNFLPDRVTVDVLLDVVVPEQDKMRSSFEFMLLFLHHCTTILAVIFGWIAQ